nr:uncharacterized protein LOC128704576 [Cherax quadricarinatus]
MACPFSGARVPGMGEGVEDGRSGRLSASERRGWDRGASTEVSSRCGSPVKELGSVQERVSSYTRMTRSPSAPVVVGRKISGGWSRRREGGVRSRPQDDDDSTPLLTPARDPPDPNLPLSLQNLTEAVWSFITIPADHLLLALDVLLRTGDVEWKALRRKLSIVAESVREWDDWHLDDLLSTLITQLEVSPEDFMRRLGLEYVRECKKQHGKALESLGFNLEGFLTNMTGICDIIKTNSNLKTKNDVPSLLCNRHDEKVVLHFFTNREPIRYFVGGVIQGVSLLIFNKNISVTCEKCETPNGNRSSHRFYFKYTVVDERVDSTGEQRVTNDASVNAQSTGTYTYASFPG